MDDVPERLLRDLSVTDAVPEWEVDARALAGRSRVLPPSELDVLRCVSYGLGYKSIGATLGRSTETVKTQLRRARYRLGAKNSTHAACEAIRRGLIP